MRHLLLRERCLCAQSHIQWLGFKKRRQKQVQQVNARLSRLLVVVVGDKVATYYDPAPVDSHI